LNVATHNAAADANHKPGIQRRKKPKVYMPFGVNLKIPFLTIGKDR
jgi:hypothetical protein